MSQLFQLMAWRPTYLILMRPLYLVSSFADNDNDNKSMFIVKVVQKSNPNNQQCKYMIYHKKSSNDKA